MKLLIVSPYFYPYTGVGALRMTSLAKYLLKQNVEIVVVKLKNGCYGSDLDSENWSGDAPNFYEYDELEMQSENFSNELMKIHKNYEFDCVILTCGPYYTIPAICSFTKRSKIPLIVDFRDLWLYDPRSKKTLRGRLGLFRNILKNHKVEKNLLEICTRFVTVSPGNLEIMQRHYPKQAEKGICIYNGYEDELLECFSSDNKSVSPFSICVLGKFAYYCPEYAKNLLYAVKRLIQEGYSINIHHIGIYEPALGRLLEETGLSSKFVVEYGQQPYQKAINLATQCSAMAIITLGLGTKVYDCIAMNKPILCLAPPKDDIEDLLKDAENAFVCRTSEKIQAAIRTMIDQKILYLTEDSGYCSQFSRTRQNKRYEDLLRESSRAIKII